MYGREVNFQPSAAERRERRHPFVSRDQFDENFFRLRGCRYRYFEQSGECHFVVSDLDLEAWQPAKERFLRDVADAAVRAVP